MSEYYRYNFILPELPTFEEIKSNGDLDLIYDLKLRNSISSFQSNVSKVNAIFSFVGSENQANVFYIDQYVRSRVDTLTYARSFDYDFDGMVNDPVFINHFSRVAVHWRANANLSTYIIELAYELKEQVNEEIEKSF